MLMVVIFPVSDAVWHPTTAELKLTRRFLTIAKGLLLVPVRARADSPIQTIPSADDQIPSSSLVFALLSTQVLGKL
jgi:hypothetical protein